VDPVFAGRSGRTVFRVIIMKYTEESLRNALAREDGDLYDDLVAGGSTLPDILKEIIVSVWTYEEGTYKNDDVIMRRAQKSWDNDGEFGFEE